MQSTSQAERGTGAQDIMRAAISSIVVFSMAAQLASIPIFYFIRKQA